MDAAGARTWISSTQFGSITIDGKTYEHDVIMTWEGKVREASTEIRHVIGENEMARLLSEKPEIIVVGTGQSGLMEVSSDETGIMIVEKTTPDAIKEFNGLVRQGKKVVAYMHVTC